MFGQRTRTGNDATLKMPPSEHHRHLFGAANYNLIYRGCGDDDFPPCP
jgi:hypothetical protein